MAQTRKIGRCLAFFLTAGLAMAEAGTCARAQEHAGLNGTVVDTTGAPIQGAQIEFRSAAGGGGVGQHATGQFRVGGRVVVSFPGFATVSREIRAHTSAEIPQIVLAPTAGLQRIEVQGTAQDQIPAVPTSQYEISAEAIQ